MAVQMASNEMTPEEKLAQAHNLKGQGNECFKDRNIKQAIGKYHRALMYLRGIVQPSGDSNGIGSMLDNYKTPVMPEVLEEAKALQVICYNNLAACILLQDEPNYSKVCQHCNSVLELSPMNTKALYRKGVALYHLRDFDTGVEVLMKARDNGASADPAVKKYLAMCEKGSSLQNESLKQAYKGMFDKMGACGNS